MINLSVKTRGNSNPQGKPRVYFSCHPDDFEKYFDLLCGEIFETQNCAIYYESGRNEDADLEDVRSRLSDMQLFVVPVTTNFLTKPSRARDFEYGLANEQHTPILPIAMEPGLDKLFPEIMNRVGEGFGDVQFLDHTSQDVTAISYDEKLKNRLDSILVGDELAERVRAAFDAYIFLSYRKSDRAEAKDLMSLIHRIPYCRDIAIWYDEFLTPGEPWHHAIAEAMAKSALVVLAVTPNLTEPGNYIIKHEYPDAKASEKEVVPAELIPTDINALRNLFPGIADTVNGRDIDEISAALRDELQKFVLTENDKNPEHNYLIGLAYLGGIDVERDTQRAAELIKGAAERELPEAIKKLADMYHDGDGVERSYEEELVWLRKARDIRKKEYESAKDIASGRALTEACCRLGDALSVMEKMNEAQAVFEEMCFYAEKLNIEFQRKKLSAREDEAYELQKLLSKSYERLGDTLNYHWQLVGIEREAKLEYKRRTMECYQKMLSLNEGLAEKIKTAEAKRNLSVSYERFGDIELRRLFGKETAKSWYEKSLAISEELAEMEKTAEAKRDLSIGYGKMGDAAKGVKDWNAAEDWYMKCLEVRRVLLQENETDDAKRDLSNAFEKLGNLAQKRRNLQDSMDWYLKCLEINEELAARTKCIIDHKELSFTYRQLGFLAEDMKDYKGALVWYQKTASICDNLWKTIGNYRSERVHNIAHGYIERLKEICPELFT